MLALFRDIQTFSQKFFCAPTLRHILKTHKIDISQAVFVQTVKVAGIDVAVCFYNELTRASSGKHWIGMEWFILSGKAGGGADGLGAGVGVPLCVPLPGSLV